MTASPSAVSPDAGMERYLRHVALERGLSENSRAAYRRDLTAYAAWLEGRGIRDLADVSPETLSEYVADLARPAAAGRGGGDPASGDPAPAAPSLAPASITRRLSTVRGMHRFLFEEGLLPSYAGSGVRTPKRAQRLPKALAIEEVEALLAAAGGGAALNGAPGDGADGDGAGG
ncbi:MAG: site-specific integrase, partial [Leucobacter sp.]